MSKREVDDTMKMNLEQIKTHWEEAGRQIALDLEVSPTSRDPFLGQLEEDGILSSIQGSQHVLEIGCGDGLHTVKYAKCADRVSGLDVAETLVELAAKRMSRHGITNVDLSVGSVLDMVKLYGAKSFDCVISQRCLINLPEWSHQKEAMVQVRQVLKRGGLFILTEGFQDGLAHLNKMRHKLGLDEIKEVTYNRSLIRKDFERFARSNFDIVAVHDYGLYLFLSRVFHPLAVSPKSPKHHSKLNEAAMQIARATQSPSFRRYSYNLCYVLRKK